MSPDPRRMAMQQSDPITTTEVEAALRAVLDRPEYAPVEPPLLHRMVRAVTEWFAGDVWPALRDLIPVPDASDPGWRIVGTVVLTLGAVIGLAVLAIWAVRAVRWWRHRAERRSAGPVTSVGPVTAADWDHRAAAAAENGEWRVAAHALYQATLLRLGDAGVIRVDPSKTPGDYRREARRRVPDRAGELDGFLRWFERVAYGRDDPGPDHYARLADTAEGLVHG
ncbi:MAG: DUF4129 domain-containing protein [Gemmatimonadota bacterium]